MAKRLKGKPITVTTARYKCKCFKRQFNHVSFYFFVFSPGCRGKARQEKCIKHVGQSISGLRRFFLLWVAGVFTRVPIASDLKDVYILFPKESTIVYIIIFQY